MISLGAYASWIGSILDEILRTEGHCSTGTVKTEFSIGFFWIYLSLSSNFSLSLASSSLMMLSCLLSCLSSFGTVLEISSITVSDGLERFYLQSVLNHHKVIFLFLFPEGVEFQQESDTWWSWAGFGWNNLKETFWYNCSWYKTPYCFRVLKLK